MFNILKKKNKEETKKDNQEVLYQTPEPTYEPNNLQTVENKENSVKDLNLDSTVKSTEEKPEISNPNIDIFTKKVELIDAIAPKIIETDFDYIKINDTYFRTIFVSGYPRFVSPGWLEPIINFNNSLDISFYIYPIEGKSVLDDLRRKITEMEAEIATDIERGKVINPNTQAKLEDALTLQEQGIL
jgi:hypothetical protein